MALDHAVNVLLEVEGSRREICIKRGEDALVCLERELGKIGKDARLKISPTKADSGASTGKEYDK